MPRAARRSASAFLLAASAASPGGVLARLADADNVGNVERSDIAGLGDGVALRAKLGALYPPADAPLAKKMPTCQAGEHMIAFRVKRIEAY